MGTPVGSHAGTEDEAFRSSSSGDHGAAGPLARSLGTQQRPSSRQPFPKQLSDKYRLGEELGRGAYGQVFRGLDARTGGHVAIKQISLDRIPSGALASIMTEVELLKALNHQNVVKYLGSLRNRTHLYIIMELIEGGSLASITKPNRFGPFPEEVAAVYIQQVLQGLMYLHDQGVVHRDIKGANILTTRDGVVKLADFGVAARMGEGGCIACDGDTQPAGTPYWMAPEVVELKTVTTASDIWSVGCLTIELIMGQPPYFDLQPLSALYNIVQDAHPPLPPRASAGLKDFLLQCFKKDPAKRPSAKLLLNHSWITLHRRNLRSTWKQKKNRLNGEETLQEAHETVVTVVDRFLENDSNRTSFDANGSGTSRTSGVTVGKETTTPLPGGASGKSGNTPYGIIDSASELSSAAGSSGNTTGGTAVKNNAFYIWGPQCMNEEAVSQNKLLLEQVDADVVGLSLLANFDKLSIASHPALLGENNLNAKESIASEFSTTALNDEADVRRQVNTMRLLAPSGERSLVEEAAAAASARTLIRYVLESEALRRVFIAADGLCGLRESLDSPSERLLTAALDLLLALTSNDNVAMELACSYGIVPAALRLAGSQHPMELRLKAAAFATSLARCSAAGAHVLVACQGVPFFLSMMDECPQSVEQLSLLRAAASGFWTLLYRSQTAGWALSTNAYLRLMAHHGLPHRLVKILPWVLKHASIERSAATSSIPGPSAGIVSPMPTVRRSPGYGPNTGSGVVSGGVFRPSNRVVPEDAVMVQEAHLASPQVNSTSSHRLPSSSASASTSTSASTSSQKHHESPVGALSEKYWTDSELLESLIGLFVALSYGDVVVKARCCQVDTMNGMFSLTVRMPPHLQRRVLRAVRRLTLEQSVLANLEAANVVAYVVAQLPRMDAPALQAEALMCLHNLCQLSKSRQEAVAASGAVSWICRLAIAPPDADLTLSLEKKDSAGKDDEMGATTASAESAAVAVLCSFAHCSPKTRSELWSAGALDILLQLLKEEAHAASVLEAVASWLDAEAPRIESRLLQDTALARMVFVVRSSGGSETVPLRNIIGMSNPPAPGGGAWNSPRGQGSGTEQLPSVLSPLIRIIGRSPKLAVALASAGLASNVIDLLRRRPIPPTTALSLMDVLQLMYEAHPHPKEFLAAYRVAPALSSLAAAAEDQVLVRTRIDTLLRAFSVNTIF